MSSLLSSLSEYIDYYTQKKTLLHTLFLLVFRTIESLQCILKSLYAMLPPKASVYVKSYDGQKNYFLIEEDGLSEKYKNIWNKVSTDTIKEF